MSTLTSASVSTLTDSNYNRKYLGNLALLDGLMNATSTSRLLSDTTIKQLFNGDFSQAFVSLRYYPMDLLTLFNGAGKLGDYENVVIGATELNDSSNPCRGWRIKRGNVRIDLGSITLDRASNNFTDFSPYTRLSIFYPYIGFIDADPSDFYGETVHFYYLIDFESGNCSAYAENSKRIFSMANGKLGIDIPIGGTNAADRLKSVMTSSLGIVGGVASIIGGAYTSNPMAIVGGITTIANSSISMVAGMQTKIDKGTSASGSTMTICPQNIFITITRPKIQDSVNYIAYKGKPLGKTRRISDLRGFTRCNGVHIEGFGRALESEKTAMETILKSGIII